MNDIETEEDIAFWMDSFYRKLLTDEVTAPVFKGLNLEAHMPKLVDFWAFILLDKEGYKTNVFEKHIHLHLEKHHFDRWLLHFRSTTDDLFKGEKAELVKQRAKLLATTFYYKLHGVYEMF